jgi:hypothetical protein
MIDIDLAALRAVTGVPVAATGNYSDIAPHAGRISNSGIWRVASDGWSIVLTRVGHS